MIIISQYCTAEYPRMWLCQDEEEWSGYLGIKTSPGPGCWLSISKINWPPCNMKYSQERSWLPHLLPYYIAIAKVSTICTWRVEVEVYKVRLVVVAGSHQPQPAAACRTCFQLARRDNPPTRLRGNCFSKCTPIFPNLTLEEFPLEGWMNCSQYI